MTQRDAEILAAELNERAPVSVTYEVRETESPKGEVSPFYVARVVDRSARDRDDSHGDAERQPLQVASGYSSPAPSADGDEQLALAVS